MSSRNFRKLCGNALPPPDSDDSDGDFDPLPGRSNQTSTYEGLVVSSDSESERAPEADDEDTQEAEASNAGAQGGARKKKSQKKGKGKGKKTRGSGDGAGTSGTSSGRRQSGRRNESTGEELDEIDKSLMEVNAILGEPPPAPEQKVEEQDELQILLECKAKHLNVAFELRRLFGPDDPEEARLRSKTQPHRQKILKRVMVCPTHDTQIYDFKKTGLSMSIEKKEGRVTHFVYDHDEDLQKRHNAFLVKYAKNFMRQGTPMFNMEESRKFMHVESLLEIADTLFRMDENSMGNEIIENVITYLQYTAHPSFNLASVNVRLSYNYAENRPFHVSMLKYMYLLSNKACHRTALEIAKMLINLDPCDPLAVLFVIDTLALRAREHQWLIDTIEYFHKHRQIKMMFNIQYSFALAHFHVATKTKKDLSEADEHLQNAIMSYPRVVYRILEFASVNDAAIRTHKVYTTEPQQPAGEGLSELMLIYAKLTWPRWREPQVLEWLIRNAKEVIVKFDESQDYRERVRELAVLRHNIFQVWPTEIMRHISIIRSMSNLLLETTLSPSTRPTSSWDPLFDRGINRYSNWTEQTLFMAHFIGTRGRTHHASAFDPWQGMLEFLMPRIQPATRSIAQAPTPPGGQNPGSSGATDESSSSGGPSPNHAASLQLYRGHNYHHHHFGPFFNPYGLNGIIPDRLFHPNVPAYALNFVNMFQELLESAANARFGHFTDSSDSLEESDLDDLLFNPTLRDDNNDDEREPVNDQPNGRDNDRANSRADDNTNGRDNDRANIRADDNTNGRDNDRANSRADDNTNGRDNDRANSRADDNTNGRDNDRANIRADDNTNGRDNDRANSCADDNTNGHDNVRANSGANDNTNGRDNDRANSRADDNTNGRDNDRANSRADDNTNGRDNDRANSGANDNTNGRDNDRANSRADDNTNGRDNDRANSRADDNTNGRDNGRANSRADDNTNGRDNDRANSRANDNTNGRDNDRANSRANDNTNGRDNDRANSRANDNTNGRDNDRANSRADDNTNGEDNTDNANTNEN